MNFKKIFLNCILTISIVALSSCGTNNNTNSDSKIQNVENTQSKDKKYDLKDNMIYDFEIDIEDIVYGISKTDKQPIIVALMKCTNNSDRVDSFRGQFEDQVTVNGTALDRASLTGSEYDKYDFGNSTVQLLPGDSIFFSRAWYITEDIPLNSEFKLMIYPYFNNDDYVVKKFTFDENKISIDLENN